MAVVVVATVGASNANSFVDVATFGAYANNRLNAGVATTATDDDKGRAVIEATRELNSLTWLGLRVNGIQALAWPRTGVANPDAPGCDTYTSTEVPQRVTEATCELALQFLKAGTTDLASIDPNAGVIEKTVDVLTTKWADPSQRTQGLARFPRVMNSITPLLSSTAGQVRLVR
jgi:hypothetical protein